MIVPPLKFSALIGDLQRIERVPRDPVAAPAAQGQAILDAFLRHGGYLSGAVWLADSPGHPLRLAAASRELDAPPELDLPLPLHLLDRAIHPAEFPDAPAILAQVHTLVPLRNHSGSVGLVALRRESDQPAEASLELLGAASSYVTALLTAQRMADEVREGDFQLKIRLWELESLYDIGLSIASTLDQDELAEQILIRTISLLNARRAALYLRKGDRFALHRSFGEVRGHFLGDEIDARSMEALMKDRAPIRMASGADCLFPGCLSLLALPIATASEMVGVLAVADREHRDGGVGPFDENDVRLVRQFATQAAIALENARLHREALEKQAIERELELAATIQRDILPRSIPRVEGFGIDVLARPARQVGGDYYTFIEREGEFSLCVADVAGKSVAAAILVSALHAALQLLFHEGRDLGEIATELNRHIHLWSSETKFATMILATIDRENGTIRFVNAGHNPGYVVGLDGSLELLHSHGLPVGLMSDSRYAGQIRPLPPGALVALYSDGITEADNPEGEEFGNERLEQLLRRHASEPVGAIRRAIENELQRFVGDAPQRDDQTLVLVRV